MIFYGGERGTGYVQSIDMKVWLTERVSNVISTFSPSGDLVPIDQKIYNEPHLCVFKDLVKTPNPGQSLCPNSAHYSYRDGDMGLELKVPYSTLVPVPPNLVGRSHHISSPWSLILSSRIYTCIVGGHSYVGNNVW